MNIRVRVDRLWVLGPFHTIFETVHLFTQFSFEKESQTTLEIGLKYAVLVDEFTGFIWTEAGSFKNVCDFKSIRIRVVNGTWVFKHIQRIGENGNEFFCSLKKYVRFQERSSLDFFVAQCLEHPTIVWKGRGFNSHLELRMFFEFFSPHIFYLLREKKGVYLVLK